MPLRHISAMFPHRKQMIMFPLYFCNYMYINFHSFFHLLLNTFANNQGVYIYNDNDKFTPEIGLFNSCVQVCMYLISHQNLISFFCFYTVCCGCLVINCNIFSFEDLTRHLVCDYAAIEHLMQQGNTHRYFIGKYRLSYQIADQAAFCTPLQKRNPQMLLYIRPGC